MPIQLYRGDDRAPEAIGSNGFQAWRQLSPEAARALVLRSMVDADTAVALPKGESNFSAYFNASPGKLLGLEDVHRKIVTSKDRDSSMHVSTAIGEGCCGYGNQSYTYRIDVPVDRFYAWDTQPGNSKKIVSTPRAVDDLSRVHTEINPVTGLASSKPVLLTDTDNLATAKIIGLYKPVAINDRERDAEIAFLTGVPKEWIGASRARGQSDWKPVNEASTPGIATDAASVVAGAKREIDPGLDRSTAGAGSSQPAKPTPPVPPPKPQSMLTHPYQDPSHAKYGLYQQAQDGLRQLPQQPPLPLAERTLTAAALADAAHAATPPLRSIDHVAAGPNGRLFAIQGQREDPGSPRCFIDPSAVAAQARNPAPSATEPTREPPAPGPQATQATGSVSQTAKMFEALSDSTGPATPGPRR